MHLSMFLEVTDPRAPADDWSAFVSHRLAVVNQRDDGRSLAKESQNRYSRAAKDWGARAPVHCPPTRIPKKFPCAAAKLRKNVNREIWFSFFQLCWQALRLRSCEDLVVSGAGVPASWSRPHH